MERGAFAFISFVLRCSCHSYGVERPMVPEAAAIDALPTVELRLVRYFKWEVVAVRLVSIPGSPAVVVTAIPWRNRFAPRTTASIRDGLFVIRLAE